MAKALSYKLALMGGLTSTLLATAAFANTTGGLSINLIDEEGNKIEGGDHLPDRACGADESFARYLVVNEGNQPVTITDVDLVINNGDDFPFNRFIAHTNRFLPIFGTKCEEGTELHRNGGSCEIVVDLAPKLTVCLNVEDRGEIDRDLTIEYTSHHGDVAQNATLVEPINFEIDLEGGIEKYAVMADRIYIREDVTDPNNVIYSHLQVEQDVTSAEGLLGFYAYPQNIWFNDGFFEIFAQSYPAFYDARELADRLEDLVDDFGSCNQLTITGIPDADPTDPAAQVVTPGFWCLNNPATTTPIAAPANSVDGYFIMDGDEDQLFVIALNDTSTDYFFGNNNAITVELRNGANPNNIFWLVTDKDSTLNINLLTNSPANVPTSNEISGNVLPGVILSNGTVNINDSEVLGRVIGVSGRKIPCIFGCHNTHTTVNFYGNVAIEKPSND
jgi:hypothetical protein